MMLVVVAVKEEGKVEVSQFGSQVTKAPQKQQRGKRDCSGLFHK